MRTFAVVCAVTASLNALPADAVAQPPRRTTLSVNGAFQPTKQPFTQTFQFDVNRETATTTARYGGENGPLIDGSVVVNLWRNVGVGVAISHFSRDLTARTESDVPHPFFFNTPRHIAGDINGLHRTERGVHTHVVYGMRLARALRLAVFAGPSFVQLKQDTITTIEYDERFPFDTATFRGAQRRRSSGSSMTFNAGADVAWMFAPHLGVGGMTRFAEATIDLDLGNSRTQRVTAGGFTAGAGIRVAF